MEISDLFDPVTQTYRETVFQHLLSREAMRAVRHQEPFAVCVLRLDGIAGQRAESPEAIQLIQLVSNQLRAITRVTDILGRLQRDFTILLLRVGPEEMQEVVARIRAHIEAFAFPSRLTDASQRLTMSIGSACFPSDANDDKTLLATAYRRVGPIKLHGEP